MAQKKPIIYEGKSKILFEGPEDGTLIQHFKDDIAIPEQTDANKTYTIFGKGVLSNRISAYLMTQLDTIGIPNHFLHVMNMREQLVRDTEMLHFDVIVRNAATGDFCDRFGVPEGTELMRPIIEFYFKNKNGKYVHVSDEHILTFGWATPDEIDDILFAAMRTNDFLTGLFHGVGLKLIDIKLEFGRIFFEDGDSLVIMSDEISPDSCHLWDRESKENFGRGALQSEDGGGIKRYQEIARRLGLLPEGQITPDTPVPTDLLLKLKSAGDLKKPPSPIRK